jgi:sugar O-acyltransferase (sialic acid O-acetyltransferase NeuD family)
MDEVILHGGGEHARVVLDCLQSSGCKVLALFDPKYTGFLMGVPQRGAYNPQLEKQAKAVVAIGDNALRKEAARNTQHPFTNAVHPSAIVSKYATVGTGCMILHDSIVQAQAEIGDHVIINTGAQVDHDCVISDFVHIAPGATLCGNVAVGEGALIGAGAVILPGKRIGPWAIVGAGSVVTHDVPNLAVVAGNPAKVIKQNKI